MTPTRLEIYNKIGELSENKREGIIAWLNELECPTPDKEAILSDLESYDNF